MSVITLNVDEARRTLSSSDKNVFVINDKNVDIVRFALMAGFADIAIDEHSALRVMYQRPGETEVRAKTLTYYDTDGIRKYYDWELLAADLAEKGTITAALCILRIDSEVEEWHTTPYQIRVLGSIHTDDSDEADETITPTVAQRVAVLETMIQRVASGAPIVVGDASEMVDTDKIYVLSTDGYWYYYDGAEWQQGGEYGAVATDSTLTRAGIPADAKVVGDALRAVSGRFTDNMKQALLDMFAKVAYIDDNGQDYIDALASAFYAGSAVQSISVVFTAPDTDITTETPINSLKNYLAVTAIMDDGTTEAVAKADYIITGTLTGGKCALTVAYSGKTDTFECLVAYELAEAVTLTESDKIDTGWATTYADELSVCCDVTIDSLHGNSDVNMLWSTFVTGAGDAYFALSAALRTDSTYRLWGAGISYANGAGNITGVNQRIRSVAIVNMQTGVITNRFYNVTNNVSKNLNNTYNVSYLESNGRHIFIGHPNNDGGSVYGIDGTVHSFKVFGRALTENEITAYLAGE